MLQRNKMTQYVIQARGRNRPVPFEPRVFGPYPAMVLRTTIGRLNPQHLIRKSGYFRERPQR